MTPKAPTPPMAPLAEDQAALRASLSCDTSQAPEDLMPHISQPAQPQAGLSTPQSGTGAQPAAPEHGQGGLAGRVTRAARGGLMAMLAGLLLVVTLVAMPGAAQAQTAAESVTFDGKLQRKSDNPPEEEANGIYMPIGEYAFQSSDSFGIPTLPNSLSAEAPSVDDNFNKIGSNRASRWSGWVRFPGFSAGDDVEVRLRKLNPESGQNTPHDNFWWVVSPTTIPGDWVDPQNINSLPQSSSQGDYADSPQPQGLLGPTSTANWPIGEQSYRKGAFNGTDYYVRGGLWDDPALATDWQATITVASCGNFFAVGKGTSIFEASGPDLAAVAC